MTTPLSRSIAPPTASTAAALQVRADGTVVGTSGSLPDGLQPGALLGLRVEAVVAPESVAGAAALLAEAQAGQPAHAVLRFQNGAVYDVISTPLARPDGPPGAWWVLLPHADRHGPGATAAARLIALLGHLPGVAVYALHLRPPQRLIAASPTLTEWLGRPAESLADGDAWLHVVHPDDRTRLQQAGWHTAPVDRFDQAYRLLRADGTTLPVRELAVAVPGADGAPGLWCGLLLDRRAAGVMTALNADRPDALLDAIPTGMLAADASGTIQLVNPAFCLLLGLPSPEMLQGQPLTVLLEQCMARGLDSMALQAWLAEPWAEPATFSCPDGLTVEALTLPEGVVLLARPAPGWPEQQLADALLEQLPLSLFIALGAPGDARVPLRLLYLSPYAARLLGHDRPACLDAAAVLDAIHPDDLLRVVAGVEAAARQGHYRGEVRVRAADGQYRWLAVDAVRLTSSLPLWAGQLSDLTAERAAIEALAARTAMLHAVLDAEPAGILFEDAERRIQLVNPAFCALFGLPGPEAVIGHDCRAAAQAASTLFADPAGFLDRIESLVASQSRYQQDELVLADGRIFRRDFIPVDGPSGRIGIFWRYEDITVHKRAQEQLEEIIQHLPAALIVVSTERQILPDGTPAYPSPIINPQIEDLTGYTPAEWDTPGRWARSLHPDDRDWVIEAIEAAHAADAPVRIDYRLVRKDGRVIWVRHEEVAGYMPSLPGRCRIALLFDVTAQKQAEEALRQTRDQLYQLLEQLPAALAVFASTPVTLPGGGIDFPTVIMNKRVAELMGYPLEDWQQPGAWARALHPDDRERVLEAVRQAEQANVPLTIEYRICTADGRVRWLRHEEAPVTLPGIPSPTRVALAFDITAEKEAEAALRATESRYRTLVEQLPAAVLVTETGALPQPDGVPGWPVRYVSPKIIDITGYSAEESARPGTWARLLHPDDRDRIIAQFLEAEQTGQSFQAVYRIIRKDGRVAWIRHHATQVTDGERTLWQEILLDVTAEKAAEEALQAAELRFQALVEQQPGALLVIAPERQSTADGLPAWETLYVSPQVERVTGHSPEAWQQPGIWVRNIHPDDRARVLAALDEAERTGTTFRAEYRFRRADGQWVWLRHESTPVRDATGNLRYYQGLIVDVTAERTTAEALAQLQERYRTLVEAAPVVVYEAPARDVAATFYVSPHVERLLGYTPQEWLAMPKAWQRHVHPDDLPAAVAAIHAAADAGQPFSIIYRMIRRDGRIIWVQDIGTPGLDAHGTLIVHGVMLDVTAQREAEMALRAAEARYRTLVEQLPGALIVVDAPPMWGEDGLPRYHTRFVSPQIVDLTGYTPEEWQEPGIWASRIHPEDRSRVLRAVAELDEHEQPLHLEYRLVRKDGRVVWVRHATRWVREEDGQTTRHTLLLDISAEKEAERQRQALEQRYRLLVEQIPAALFLADARDPMRLLYVSPYIEAVTGYAPEAWQVDDSLLTRIVHPADLPHFTAAWSQAIQTSDRFQHEFRFRHARGHDVWVYGDAVLVRDAGGRPLYWHGLFLDMTERKRAEQLLLGQSAVLSRIVQQAPLSEVLETICRVIELQRPGVRASILLVDEQQRLRHGAAPNLPPDYIQAIDGLAAARTGAGTCGRAVALGEPVVTADIEADPNWAAWRTLARQHGLRACWSMPAFSSDGRVVAVFALYASEPSEPDTDTWRLLELAAQLVALAVERWQADEQLRFQALHDPLTGLPNRTLFYDRLEHALEHATREGHAVAVIFLDLDRFKAVNDTYGHPVGDELLVALAARLRAAVRAGDTVARFAGDEFTVLLERVDGPAEAVQVAERLLEALRQPVTLSVGTVQISGSVGVAISTATRRDGDLLLAADQALYAAKRAGRDRVVVAP